MPQILNGLDALPGVEQLSSYQNKDTLHWYLFVGRANVRMDAPLYLYGRTRTCIL